MILKRASLIHNDLFIEFEFFRTNTATLPVTKSFKRFPVDPSPEYVIEIKLGYIAEDFNKKDVLIEILNIKFHLEELRKNGIIGFSYEYLVEKEVRILCKLAEIIL